jgi:hypothetical protein
MDIIFVNKLFFLLGVLTPLGLGFVRYIRDRSEAEVGMAAQRVIAKATRRSFDIGEPRCDGEGGIGA